ncbi:hypothetical protein E2C01_079636 [Portunus trituberculatus]|uniref:Uncharacterized protein n=1 Tax=Portunus trituberculatus TaxID=210409 RepID=A0A5B7IQU8_PORTR|nr:hypothetical protein [Portunus trituberculatus]
MSGKVIDGLREEEEGDKEEEEKEEEEEEEQEEEEEEETLTDIDCILELTLNYLPQVYICHNIPFSYLY